MSNKPENNDMPISASESDNAEVANYPELARANLARLRGDYDLAERQCMALLKQTPHHPTVAALLGDVSAEQGKLDEAAQWYEMAVDAGASSGIGEKLDTIRHRIKERDAATSEREIGLPPRTWASPPVLLGSGVIVLMLLVCAYIAGTYRAPVKPTTIQEQAPIVLPSTGPAQVPDGAAKLDSHTIDLQHPATPVKPTEGSVSPGSQSKSGIDADLQPYFADSPGPLARVSAATSDPRSHSVSLDVPLQNGEDPRAVAAQVAQAALTSMKDPTTLTVRLVSNGKLVFMADCTRDKLDAYMRAEHGPTDVPNFADQLLSNEWKEGSDTAAAGR